MATWPGSARRSTRPRETLPTYRAHNEQGMALAAVAFAKARNRRQMMACTTSIGPGCMNMLTAAGVAHVNRLPVLFLPGDVFATLPPPTRCCSRSRTSTTPPWASQNAFRSLSRWWDRITRPEQLLTSLPRAMQVLTDPVECGPVTLAMCPGRAGRGLRLSRELLRTACAHHHPAAGRRIPTSWPASWNCCATAERPLIVAGGGVLSPARPRSTAHRLRRQAPHPRRRNSGGQERDRLGSSAGGGLDRRHRQLGRQHAGARSRRDPGRRHAAAGLHDRLARSGAGRSSPDPAQHSGFRRGQTPRRAACRRRASGRWKTSPPPSAGTSRSPNWQQRTSGADQGVEQSPVDQAMTADQRCSARPTLKWSAPCNRARPGQRHRRLRRRRPAGRVAQAVASRRSQRLPHGIRLSPAWATRSPAAWA